MPKISELYVEVFDWPDRFLVEPDGPDIDYCRWYPELRDEYPLAPYLVDLSETPEGWCACRDFAVNIAPFLHLATPHRTTCKHILAARDYLRKHNYLRPKPLPKLNL